MRINAGKARGRAIPLPRGVAIRPTADKVKQALFNILGPMLPGARVLDLLCGSGGLGLEAMSRDASFVCFCDKELACVNTAGSSARSMNFTPGSFITLHGDAFTSLKKLRAEARIFDVILLDPPYDSELGTNLLHCPDLVAILAAGSASRVVLEHSNKGAAPSADVALRELRSYVYGQTSLSFFGRAS